MKNKDDFKIEDDLKKENVILKTVPGPCLYDPSSHCFYTICRIFMKVYEDFFLFTSVAQTINSVPNTYSNIFVKHYEYQIYS